MLEDFIPLRADEDGGKEDREEASCLVRGVSARRSLRFSTCQRACENGGDGTDGREGRKETSPVCEGWLWWWRLTRV